VKASHRYSVRVRITRGARLLFTTDQAYPVLTHGQGSEVTLQLRRVGGGRQTAESMSRSLLGELPASFVGDLPCADCPGIRFRLDLFPDQSFFLRMTYLDRGPEAIIHEIGSWATSSDGQILVLHGSRGATELFAVMDANTLRKLNTQGQQFESALNYDLARTESVQPIEPRLTVRGLYRYGADAGQFIECLTRRRLPVAQEGDNAAMEAAYLNARRQPEEDLLVTLEGRIAMHPRMEGDGLQPTLVVERFLGVWPGETCGARFGVAALEDTYWKLTRLGGRPVIVGERQREPHLILRSEIHRVSGSAGCNRLVGEYHVEGRRLSFEKMATTRMACAEGLETEEKFLAALEQVKTWKIVGEHLELYDAHGAFLARFETRHLP
jgi:copper homeostasis protein (lipoprotein)